MQGMICSQTQGQRPRREAPEDRPLPGGWWILPAQLTGMLAWGEIGQLLWRHWPG